MAKPDHIAALKKHLLIAANLQQLTRSDCRLLSDKIAERTGRKISVVTLEQIFDFTETAFEPSLFTLNTLALFCCFQTWEAFCNHFDYLDANPVSIQDPLTLAVMETSTPLAVLATNAPNFTILNYNQAFENDTHIQRRPVRGLTWWQAFNPEIAESYGPTLLLEAFHEAIYTQQTVQLKQVRYDISSTVTAIADQSWWDFMIVPVKYDAKVSYLLLHINNITTKILHQDAVEQAILKELTEAENLAVTNVKLNRVIDRLAESHQELFQTKKQLEEWVFERTKKLFESEDRQRKVIDDAPVGFAVLKGPEHLVETANRKVIEYWGKGPDVVGKPLADVLPEIRDQGFVDILNEVHRSGIAYVNPELRVFIDFNGTTQPRYFDMIYKPIQHEAGVTDSIFIVAFDITEQVTARKRIEASESLLRLAVNAANIGIWSVNLRSKVLSYNAMFASITGWDKDRLMTYDEGLNCVDEDMQQIFKATIKDVDGTNKELNYIYQHKRFDNGRIVWLNAIGNLAVNDAGEHVLSGIVKEISAPN